MKNKLCDKVWRDQREMFITTCQNISETKNTATRLNMPAVCGILSNEAAYRKKDPKIM